MPTRVEHKGRNAWIVDNDGNRAKIELADIPEVTHKLEDIYCRETGTLTLITKIGD